MGDVLTRKCRHGVLINEGFPFDDVPQHHTTPDTTVWIDLCRPSKSSTSGPPETLRRRGGGRGQAEHLAATVAVAARHSRSHRR